MTPNRLAIIGAGSSGLVTLKVALEHLKNWEIRCYEKTDRVTGCWGHPYPGFVSTSTKYTTQFSCYRKYDDTPYSLRDKKAFFKEGEYGEYLEEFAQKFKLHDHIELNTEISYIGISQQGKWRIQFADCERDDEEFTHLVLCTGLAEKPKNIKSTIPTLQSVESIDSISGKSVVVMGGGESAADIANRLSASHLNNKVYLSLRRGIRVSPRYHPIRGVPSDFLRNRLMLSIHRDLRNRIGQKFVEARIQYQELFEYFFPNRNHNKSQISKNRKKWDRLLTQSAKDSLFNMFHNKSDGFLDAVGEGRIQIIGPALNEEYRVFKKFENDEHLELSPDFILPKIGYSSGILTLFGKQIRVRDFYLGCVHIEHENLFLVGFSRPIIGNIPSISEQQAQYIVRMIQGQIKRDLEIKRFHQKEREHLAKEFPKLDIESMYPVEMFPYLDVLAKKMNTYPSFSKLGSLKQWLKIQLSPASTMQYVDENYDSSQIEKLRIYTPPILNGLLAGIKLLEQLFYRPLRKN